MRTLSPNSYRYAPLPSSVLPTGVQASSITMAPTPSFSRKARALPRCPSRAAPLLALALLLACSLALARTAAAAAAAVADAASTSTHQANGGRKYGRLLGGTGLGTWHSYTQRACAGTCEAGTSCKSPLLLLRTSQHHPLSTAGIDVCGTVRCDAVGGAVASPW